MVATGFLLSQAGSHPAKWSTFDRELFACMEGIRHFMFVLEGWSFTIFTDHKPLVGL
jgi:hypothetical protein